jgi:ubiquinone/menaquinone biosynthesis C-methylase UbiE
MVEQAVGGSYRPRELPGGLDEELQRLAAQVALSWRQEQRLLERLGMRDGQRILELGSGPGLFTVKLRDWLPNSSIDCVEIDPVLAGLARERCGDDTGVRIQVADVNQLEPHGDGYDWIIARYLFQHLADPAASAARLLPLLRPGGRLAVIDVDAGLWGIAQPFFPEIQSVYRKADALQTTRGGNRLIGRALYRLLSEAGYSGVELESYVYHSDACGLAAFESQISPDRLRPALTAGLIDADEWALVEKAHSRFMASPDAYVMMVGLLAHGQRPG